MKKREWMVLLTAALAAGAFGSTNVFAEEDLSSTGAVYGDDCGRWILLQ